MKQDTVQKPYRYSAVATAIALALAACAKAPAPPVTEAPPALAAPKLPVSLNAVMVALVDHSAHPIWNVASRPPKDDRAWGDVERHAYQLAVAGTLITLAGTGKVDEMWVRQPEWQKFAAELGSAGMEALTAAQAKNLPALNAAGDKIVAVCEACHDKFKPELPTEGIMHPPEFPE